MLAPCMCMCNPKGLLNRKYLEDPCVWVESNTTTLSILSSRAEIGLGWLLLVSLFSWQRNIVQTFMYWQHADESVVDPPLYVLTTQTLTRRSRLGSWNFWHRLIMFEQHCNIENLGRVNKVKVKRRITVESLQLEPPCNQSMEKFFVALQTWPRRYGRIRHATSKRSKHFILLI
ncbi:hypothetical protein ERO13_A10G225466v2 [Gossypium hirsutum]|uniref:Uncharacterized protein isoform X1 n=1 Tax=Gossypium hirsutum TaxID=3635 RepID=A0ABM2YUG9_GOSHI|nr:uncharacterized protein LOC107936651 isoform X1 [Gossypium hirsutum]XP_040934140.1 uncharacterized protein LOC107936651 isoform X1 [Gossypium hirsutum]XP_040934141.1 uncharacterized protein LOC107936651 isoform X1 [Gossypium hirsutum]XP_040934142.1 uncharacterized protein LOC107936651 isoform X1 [Gossypium hirsutum]XP_040934143.1 uncharacterized protein LOC107936651 isoform X1 [Gossypium hirsutum]XP_040934144.1 uncharacterized protein LOC107936651 isoform X1 [Gossypium hirsutum]XP_04093414